MLTTTLNLGWALLFEEPLSRGLWLGKGTPRAWWCAGEIIALHNAATRYGRLSYTAVVGRATVKINVSVPEAAWADAAAGDACTSKTTEQAWCAAPRGGLMVRLRLPDGAKIGQVSIGAGELWTGRADSETLAFSLEEMAVPGLLLKLQSILVTY